jgi:hypothetical protein
MGATFREWEGRRQGGVKGLTLLTKKSYQKDIVHIELYGSHYFIKRILSTLLTAINMIKRLRFISSLY